MKKKLTAKQIEKRARAKAIANYNATRKAFLEKHGIAAGIAAPRLNKSDLSTWTAKDINALTKKVFRGAESTRVYYPQIFEYKRDKETKKYIKVPVREYDRKTKEYRDTFASGRISATAQIFENAMVERANAERAVIREKWLKTEKYLPGTDKKTGATHETDPFEDEDYLPDIIPRTLTPETIGLSMKSAKEIGADAALIGRYRRNLELAILRSSIDPEQARALVAYMRKLSDVDILRIIAERGDEFNFEYVYNDEEDTTGYLRAENLKRAMGAPDDIFDKVSTSEYIKARESFDADKHFKNYKGL